MSSKNDNRKGTGDDGLKEEVGGSLPAPRSGDERRKSSWEEFARRPSWDDTSMPGGKRPSIQGIADWVTPRGASFQHFGIGATAATENLLKGALSSLNAYRLTERAPLNVSNSSVATGSQDLSVPAEGNENDDEGSASQSDIISSTSRRRREYNEKFALHRLHSLEKNGYVTAFPETIDEPVRLKKLQDLNVLDSPPDEGCDNITRMAAATMNTPVALISLIDKDRQWFKSNYGEERMRIDACETGRDVSFCGHAVLDSNSVLVVRDAAEDERFAGNPLVTGDPHIRFYAGAVLRTTDGVPLGTLCCIDNKPHEPSPVQLTALEALAKQAVMELELRTMVSSLRTQAKLNESLLYNVLPPSVVASLLADPEAPVAHHFPDVTIMFIDIVKFTQYSSRVTADVLVGHLNEIFMLFDAITEARGLYKIKTIGDGYLVVGGLPDTLDNHPSHIVSMAIECITVLPQYNARRGTDFQIRCGVHTGAVIAGVIGRSRFGYDVWSDAVNVASRMEAIAQPGCICITPATHQRLVVGGDPAHEGTFAPLNELVWKESRNVQVKGKGLMNVLQVDPTSINPLAASLTTYFCEEFFVESPFHDLLEQYKKEEQKRGKERKNEDGPRGGKRSDQLTNSTPSVLGSASTGYSRLPVLQPTAAFAPPLVNSFSPPPSSLPVPQPHVANPAIVYTPPPLGGRSYERYRRSPDSVSFSRSPSEAILPPVLQSASGRKKSSDRPSRDRSFRRRKSHQ